MTSNHYAVIGVDLGGTKIAFAAADRSGRILAEHVEPTLAAEGVDPVIGRIARGIEQVALKADCPIAAIGIGSPGPIEPERGIVLNAVNLGWIDVPLVEKTRARIALDAPIWAQNDVNVGALGEYVFGAARGTSDFVYLAVGTGLGGGAVANGALINGAQGVAMEVGHMSLDPQGRLCGCGTRGCAEMYVSGKGLLAGANAYRDKYPDSPLNRAPITTTAILDADRAGDPLAARVIDEAGDALGTVMAWCIMILNPALFVIGGGMGKILGDRLLDRARDAVRVRVFPGVYPQIKIAPSLVESSALGAAALAWYQLDKGTA